MISSNQILIYCSNLDHKNCVQQVCFNLSCKIGRLQCVQCIKNEEHSSHPEDQYEIEDMVKYIQEIQTKCDELVDKLSSYVQLIEVELNILKQGLLNKYQIPIHKLNKLKNIQINVAFDEMLKFQESTSLITQNLEKFTNEFINELKRNYNELRLNELNYLELDKKELQEAEQLYKQGYTLRSSNKYEEALKFLDQSIALNPNHLLALSCKAYCLRMLSKFNEAIIWADKALALDPKHLNTIYVKARSLYCQLKYTQAIKWADIGLQIDPNHQNFYDTKVRSLILIGQNHEAITMINKILSINPEDANFLKLKVG
ncbi:unnamed protein product [Paramecium primaurelia]|uniref:Tetratricopeptide repeat protein n=1 Tax=Paramecium primaurelia TaxID=5886 RepID=A0A8S1PYN8_PARPR|nr:unnamed protein product [Paramecium primaurelia]